MQSADILLLITLRTDRNGQNGGAKDGCETKPPILEWYKTADFENGTKSPIFKTGQNSRFVIIHIASLRKDKSCSR